MAEPQYPQYTSLLEQARATMPRFASKQHIDAVTAAVAERGHDWATAVLGRSYGGLRRVSSLEAHLLLVAHANGVVPPLPAAVVAGRQAQRERNRAELDRREVLAAADAAAWQEASAGCPVPLEVRANTRGRRYRTGSTEPLRHAVPTTAANSGRRSRPRVHLAGRALCETPERAKPLQLTEPVDGPATCVRCLKFARLLRPA